MTALLPAFAEVCLKLGHLLPAPARSPALGKLVCAQPPSHCLDTDGRFTADGRLREATPIWIHDAFIALQPALTALLLPKLRDPDSVTVLGSRGRLQSGGVCLRWQNQFAAMRFQHPGGGRRQVQDQVESVGRLLRLGSARGRTVRMEARPVTGNDTATKWLTLHPSDDWVRRS